MIYDTVVKQMWTPGKVTWNEGKDVVMRADLLCTVTLNDIRAIIPHCNMVEI